MGKLAIKQAEGVFSIEGHEEYVATIAGLLPDPLKKQFEQAVTDGEEKLELFLNDKGQELLDKIPEKYRFLLEPLKDFDSSSIDLVDFSKQGPANKSYQFQVGASASLTLATAKPEDLIPVPAVTLAVGDKLVGLTLKGSANLAASAKGSHGILSASVKASASTQQNISFFGTRSGDHRVLQYLVALPKQLTDPTDLDELIQRLDAGSLHRFERSGMPSMQLGLTVDIAAAVKAFAGALPVDAKLGGNLSVQYTDSSNCKFIVEKAGANSYLLDFKKTRKKTLSRSLKIGLDIQLVGFKNKLVEKITHALPEDIGVKELLTDLDKIIDEVSEDKLKAQLKSKLESEWPKGKSAIAFLVGEKSADKLSAELQEELQDKVLELLNSKVDPVSESAKGAADKVAAYIAEELQLPLEHRDTLEEYLSKATTDAIEKFKTELDEKLEDYIKGKGADLAELLKPWQFIGKEIGEGISSAGKNSQAALKKVRDALNKVHERYTELRQKVLKVIKDDFEEKISLTITAEKARTEQLTSAIRLEFTHATNLVRQLYKGIWNGNIQNITSMLTALNAAPEKVQLSGEYVALSNEVTKSSMAINFFGMKFSAESLFTQNAKVGLNANGILVTAAGEGELIEIVKGFGETQSVACNWHMDPLTDTRLTPPVVIKLSVEDPTFKVQKETDQFFDPLEESGLVRKGLGDLVEEALLELGLKEIEGVTLSLNVVFRWTDWLRLTGSDTKGTAVADPVDANAFSDIYLAALSETAPGYVKDARRLFKNSVETDFKKFLLFVGAIRSTHDFKRLIGVSSGSIPSSLRDAWTTARYVHDIHTSIPALQTSWTNLIKALPEQNTPLDADRMMSLKRHITAVNNDLANLLDRTTRQLNLDPSKVNGFTAAGLKVLAMQTSLPNPFVSCILESKATGKMLFN